MVVLHHAHQPAGRYNWPSITLGHFVWSYTALINYGWSGVDLFFLLSGFCLAYPVLSRSGKPFALRRYLIHRARRILPPYWTAMLLALGVALLIRALHLEPFQSSHFLELATNHPRKLIVLILESAVLIDHMLLWSYWTLPLEWRWYFIFPAVLWMQKRAGARTALPVSVLISLAAFYLQFRYPRASHWTTQLPLFLPTFALGMWAAEITARAQRTPTEEWMLRHSLPLLGLLLGIAFLFPPSYAIVWQRVLILGPLYLLLILAALHQPHCRALFSRSGLVFLGGISYSLYLTHELLIRGFYSETQRWGLAPAGQFLIYQCVVPVICVGFGWLFYLAAERPYLRKPIAVTSSDVVLSTSGP